MSKPSPNAWNAQMREELRQSDLVPFLLAIVRGEKIPERDEKGRVIGYTDPPDLGMRVSTAQALLRKIAPDVSATQLDVTSGGEGGVLRLVLAEGVAPPGAGDTIEHDSEPEALEQRQTLDLQTQDAVGADPGTDTPEEPQAAPEPPVRRRRRRKQ